MSTRRTRSTVDLLTWSYGIGYGLWRMSAGGSAAGVCMSECLAESFIGRLRRPFIDGSAQRTAAIAAPKGITDRPLDES